ncbi:MAG: hypothetical protein OMM_02311 [Candidatus Magnetoglobus multicellularis str. Araruama]|uniref:Uncharacterized protein n=1 Tax=Candidatus Magnetoglobus multicellularis str. Araruama TaxID=890399 RepID=A0A1V1PAG1_9BACT|nr:MAG: hypothetical protein OMM_02311 [Candidatus Magnetoglobus multicellularis str. Araruama]
MDAALVFSIQEKSGQSQSQVPVSILCTFNQGDVPSGKTLYAHPTQIKRTHSDNEIPVQMNHTTTYDDGSIKRADITLMIPAIDPNETQTISLITSDAPLSTEHITLDDVLGSGFTASIALENKGNIVGASIQEFIRNYQVRNIFSGPICSKWQMSGPFIASDGSEQAIQATFDVIAYQGCDRIRVTASIFNNASPSSGPYSNIYDLTMTVGNIKFIRKNISLYPFSNWSKVMWWGQEPQITIIDGGADPYFEKPIVDVTVTNISFEHLTGTPLSFGHVFKKGDITSQDHLTASFDNENSIPVQLDRKVFHADGSLRHGMISLIMPSIAYDLPETLSLSINQAPTNAESTITLSDFLQTNYQTSVSVIVDGTTYQANAKELLQNNDIQTWLSGPVVNEWHVSGPLKSADNSNHPHLTVQFYIRAYKNSSWIRTSVIIENNWTYVKDPTNFTYDISINTENKVVYQKTNFVHYHHARWRKKFWQNVTSSEILDFQPIHISHDIRYLLKTKVIPNFDPDLIGNIPQSVLNKTDTDWQKNNTPMSAGLINNWTYGSEMWPILKWTGQYLLSMDPIVKRAIIGNAELAGSFPLHYRDSNTRLPVSIDDYPHCTTHWKDHVNPETQLSEAPSKCPDGSDCTNPHLVDPARKPAYTFIPYLITGDYFFLEELHFWTNFCMIHDAPSDRDFSKGIIKGDDGDMAFSLRTLGQAAFITPEDHPLKAYFTQKLLANINYYHKAFLEDQSNAIGCSTLNKFNSIVQKDDFFTWAMGYLFDLGFTSTYPIISWKAKFPVLRLTGGDDFCWIFASNSQLRVADTNTASRYETIKDVYDKSKIYGVLDDGGFQCNTQEMADYLKQSGKTDHGIIGELIGKPWASSTPAMIQPALAVAVDFNLSAAHSAWDQYMSRSVIPNYANEGCPNFNIVPRRYEFSGADSDNDGIIDGLDECPESNPDESVNIFGCPKHDSDADGIIDSLDACPNSPLNTIVNAIGCHENVEDSDHDGISDDIDLCPNTPENSPVDSTGCPQESGPVVYEVGPGKPYSRIIDCPTHDLKAGDEIHVYYKSEPYFEKFLLYGQGNASKPIVLKGISDNNGNKPILDGTDAISPENVNCWNEDRQIIKIGQASQLLADYIIVEGFEIRNANNTHNFMNHSGNVQAYNDNASAIRIENGRDIIIRNCVIHNNGNGIQTGKETHHVLIESCHIYHNGVCSWENSYIHNMYLSGRNGNTIIVQYCYIGELLNLGQQVKSRAEKFIFRYNWLEGGRNAQLDLVEDDEKSEVISYDAYVYGNTIIKSDQSENSVMIHFGGDQPETNRMGTLYFYHNTCIIKDTKTWGSHRIFKISKENSFVKANNNIFYLAVPNSYALLSGYPNLSGSNNWLSSSITNTESFTQSITGESPLFIDAAKDDYHLKSDSPCKDAASVDAIPGEFSPNYQYKKNLDYHERQIIDQGSDIGAFEYGIPRSSEPVSWPNPPWPEDGIYVAQTGFDIDTCGAEERPCRSIKHALSILTGETKQTIYVLPGTYVENKIYIQNNTRVLGVDGPEHTKIHTAADNGIFFHGQEDAPVMNAEISGFDIYGNHDDDASGRQSGLIRLYHASNIAITHCLVHDAPFDGDCIKVSGYIENLLLDHLIVYNPASRPGEKAAPFQENIDIFGSMPRRDGRAPARNIVIRNSWLFHTDKGGHWLLYGKIDVENMLIENNIFGPSAGIDDSKGAGYGPGGVGIGTHENEAQEGLTCVNSHTVVRNNIFMFIRGDAPLEIIDSHDIWVYNNLFYHNSGPLVRSAIMFMDHVYDVGKVNLINNIFQHNQPQRDGIKASMFRNRNNGLPDPFFKDFNLYFDNILATEIPYTDETNSVYPSISPFFVQLPEPLIPAEISLQHIDQIKKSFTIKQKSLIQGKGINPFELEDYPNWMLSVTDTPIDTFHNFREGSNWDLGPFQINSSDSNIKTDTDHDGILDVDDQCPDTPFQMPVDDLGCGVTLPEKTILLSFDSETGDMNDGFDNWEYRSPKKDPVYKMTEVGGFYSSPDSEGFHKAFFPYKNISRPRIMRYGYIDINTKMPARGTGCLEFVFTGGAYTTSDNIIAYSGSEVFYKSQFDTYITSGASPYATIPLFADEQFYVKFADSKTRIFEEAQGSDRLSVWIFLPKGSHENSNFPIRTIQYYPYIETSNEDHYYHWLTNIGMGGWTHLVIDAHPQRNNTGAPLDENGNPLPYEYYRAGGHDYPGNAVAYFNRTVAFAIRFQLGDYSFPTSVYLDNFAFFKSHQPENDETISNMGVGYNPETHEFDIGFCDKYRGNGCHATYEVRYSFRPITNASYPKTKPCTVVQAPNLDFSYTTDIKGQIKKPATGYNQLWGLLKLETEDESKLNPGTTIYFAVKDISNRTYPDRDPYDEEWVEVDGMGQVRRIDLIKTISYEVIQISSDNHQ